MSVRALKNHQTKEETMSLKRKAMVLAVGAALAAPGAYAQVKSKAGTEWEFYGKFYPEMTHARGEGATAPGTTGLSTLAGTLGGNAIVPRWEMQISNTHIGFRGSKGVGGGSKAIWQLEQRVNIDEGNPSTGTAPSFANRDSFVGVANADWGTIRLGNMDTPFKKFGDTLGFLGVSSGNFVTTTNVTRKTGFGTSSSSSFNLRRANSVDFASPKILGGLQTAVQYSLGDPSEDKITVTPKRNPRVVSWGVRWEQGPLYAAFAQESHLDLFGGSRNAPAARSNFADPSVNSVDTANQFTVAYKIGVHTIEADYVMKRYKEDNVIVNGRFQEYKNNAYMLVLESRWSGAWRTTFHYVKSSAGSCTLLNTNCTTDGLEGKQLSAGVAYFMDPTVYVFVLANKLTNGSSARYSNVASTQPNPNPGESITQGAVGLAYIF
jgi:predicted porin